MKKLLLVALLSLVAACEADESSDDCVDSECTTPPQALCDGDDVLRYASTGECVNDECSYELTRVACNGGCAAGACVGGEAPIDGSGDGEGSSDGSGEGSSDGSGDGSGS